MKYLILIAFFLVLLSCEDDRKADNFFKKQTAKSEFYFVDNPEAKAVPGDLLVVQLERLNQVNNDTLYYLNHVPDYPNWPTYPNYKDTKTRGIDRIPFNFPEPATFHYRLDDNSPFTVKLLKADGNVVFKLSNDKKTADIEIAAGDYYFEFKHLEEFGKQKDSLTITPIYMQPDLARVPSGTDPYDTGTNYLLKDLYTFISSTKCVECDFSRSADDNSTYMNNLYMANTDFRGSNFEFSDISWANLENCNFSNSDGFEINMSNAAFHYCHFDNSTINDVRNMSNISFFHSILNLVEMKKGFGRRVSFERTTLISADLSEVQFDNANFNGTKFEFTTLLGAKLREGDFNYTYFRYCDMEGTSFFESSFTDILMRNCNVLDASFCDVRRVRGFIKDNIKNSDSTEYKKNCQYNIPTILREEEEEEEEEG